MTPFSTDGLKFCGIEPPKILSSHLKPSPRPVGPDLDRADGVLAVPTRLLDVAALHLGGARDGFPVGDLRQLFGRFDAVLAGELFQDHVEVDVAEPRDDQLVGLLGAVDMEGRVLLRQPGESGADLLLVAP